MLFYNQFSSTLALHSFVSCLIIVNYPDFLCYFCSLIVACFCHYIHCSVIVGVKLQAVKVQAERNSSSVHSWKCRQL